MQDILMVHAMWVKESLMLPKCETENSRQRELGLLLLAVFPSAPDAMGALLLFSKKHIAMTGLFDGKRYPLHTFVFSLKGFDSLLQTLRDIKGVDPKKPRCWSSHVGMLMAPLEVVRTKPAAKPAAAAAAQPPSTAAPISPPPPPTQQEAAEA